MSTKGRHSAPKARKVRLNKVSAIALAATVTLTSAVAVIGHASSAPSRAQSAVTKPVAAPAGAQVSPKAHAATAASKAQVKAAAKSRAHAKAVRAFKVRAHIRAVAAFKARQAAAKAKTRSHILAAGNTKASVATYVAGRSRLTSSAATRSRTIRQLRGQVASLKSQIKKPASIGKKVIAVADNYRGVPYRRGGTSPRGFDCSGYTQYVYSKLGISLPRVAADQSRAAVPVRRSFAKPGDLVFYHAGSGYVYHVGIYAGHNMVWHAPFPGRAVEKISISTHNVTFGRVSKSATQNALAITLAKKTAKLAHLIHNK
jgi:peptidoglycan DL-endopeptidase CwlO